MESATAVRIVPLQSFTPSHPKSFLANLREQQNLSQRDFAKRVSVDRNRIRRIEEKDWGDLSLSELQLVARGFGLAVENLISLHDRVESNTFSRCSIDNPAALIQSSEGTRLASFLKHPEASFIGSITIDSRKTISNLQLPQGSQAFFLILEGTLLMTLNNQEYVFKERECFSVPGFLAYELYNPQQLRKTVLLLFTNPYPQPY